MFAEQCNMQILEYPILSNFSSDGKGEKDACYQLLVRSFPFVIIFLLSTMQFIFWLVFKP
jgi:hypothetical protein